MGAARFSIADTSTDTDGSAYTKAEAGTITNTNFSTRAVTVPSARSIAVNLLCPG